MLFGSEGCIRGVESLCVPELRGKRTLGLYIPLRLCLWVNVWLWMELRHWCVVGIGWVRLNVIWVSHACGFKLCLGLQCVGLCKSCYQVGGR